MNIGSDISDKYCGAVSSIDKNAGSGYYLVKWKSNSYTFHYSNKLGNDVINVSEFF